MERRNLPASILILASCSIAGFLLIHLIVREVVFRTAEARLQDVTNDSIHRSTLNYDTALQTLQTIATSTQPHCSREDLDQLRKDLFEVHSLQDAGWMDDQHILCSAMLAQPYQQATRLHLIATLKNGVRVYTGRNPFASHSQPYILARLGQAYVSAGFPSQEFKGPSWMEFTATLALPPDPSGPRDGNISETLFTSAGSYRANHRIYATSCSSTYPLCHTASLPYAFLYGKSQTGRTVGGLCGGIIGAFSGLWILHFLRRRGSLPQQLRRAIRKRRLYVEYQPIASLKERRIVGAEVLCRWKDDAGTLIPPDQFIPIAEQRHWIDALTREIVRMALQDCGPMLRSTADFTLSINLSPRSLHTPAFIEELQQSIAKEQIPASAIAFEITESAAAHDSALIARIQTLRKNGHPIHLDDFGTGYSSLSYLHELRIDAIKIDRAFMRAIGTNSVQVDILPQILSIAQKLQLKVVVEGIETLEQENYLASISPSLLGQGWLYGRPCSWEQLQQKLCD